MVSPTKSGDGERVAMLGYVPQYEIAASLIYEALLEGTLEWVRVADPEVGSLDDIQIATTGQLVAYQVKWAEFTTRISFKDFIRDTPTKNGIKPSLFRQLSEGWEGLKQKHPDRNIKVHLAHKHVPTESTQALIPVGIPAPQHPHFQAFLKDCWSDRSWCDSGLDKAPACWKSALTELQNLSGFDEQDFLFFVSCCELEFNYKRPSESPVTNQKQARKKEDIDKIYNLLTKMAGGEKRTIEVAKDGLLDNLGWTHRFQHKFVHEFPVDQTYQEIIETVDALSGVLADRKQGYLALLGAPGSGKSTTLTRTLRYKKGFKLVRYYAYVPDSTYLGRGESNTFLHDITLSLRSHGFRGAGGNQPSSREEFLSLLSEQLSEASEKWSHDEVVTIIMVDGLDHIQREQDPMQSLLSDLPAPHTVPEGVLFVLGSQTLELNDLSDSIKAHLESEDRTITISPLSRQNVHSAINLWPECSNLSSENKNLVYDKSAGHPLSLVYLLQLIAESSHEQCASIIDGFPVYQGHIEQNYSTYWRKIEDNQGLVDLLALLSRIRVPINTRDISVWATESTIREFISKTSHYFKKENEFNWSFFHNSFRQYVLDKTGRNPFGNIDDKKHTNYHRQLADFCLQADSTSPMRWESIYHLRNAEDLQAVIEIGQQSYFREQFFCLRNFESVTDDINSVLVAAKVLEEPLVIIKCLLIECEIRERTDALDQIDLLSLLLSTEGIDSVINYVFDGRSLRIGNDEALSFAKILLEGGYSNEAKRMFEAAEPLEYLSGGDEVKSHGAGKEVLKTWVDVAHNFMEIEEVLVTIYQIRFEDKDEWQRDVEDSEHHTYLVKELVDSISGSGNEDKIRKTITLLKDRKLAHDLARLCFSICFHQFPSKLVTEAFKTICEWAEKKGDSLNDSNRLLIAELDFKVNSNLDNVSSWLEGVNQPYLYEHGAARQWKNLAPFIERIRFNRLAAALGNEFDVIKAVPDAGKSEYAGNVLFERSLVRFANIWGKSWKGENVTPQMIAKEVAPSLALFRKTHSETRGWIGWYQFRNAAIDFFKFSINAVVVHGEEGVWALAAALRKEWDAHYWPTDWRREISLALYQAGDERAELISALNKVELEIADHDEVHTRITEYSELAKVWSSIGEARRASGLLPKIFKGSFGIYHRKDRQFSQWVSWLGKYLDENPEKTEVELGRFAAALISLELSGRGRGTQEAARDLVAIATSWNVEYGLSLVRCLFEQKGLHYDSGLTGFLSGLLDRPDSQCSDVSIATRKLLLPFEGYNPSEFPEKLAYSIYTASPKEAEELVRHVIGTIKTHLLPSNRYSWLEGIVHGLRRAGCAEAKYADIAIKTPCTTSYVTNEPTMKLKTGEMITDEKARLKVGSISDLLELLRSIESVEYSSWYELIQPFIKRMDISQLEEALALIKPFSPGVRVLAAIASAFTEKGEKGKANVMLEELLNSSDAKGWDSNYDGGSRISVFKALIEIDSEQWRPKAIQSFVDDYIGEYRYPINLIWNLEEIVEVLFEKPDIAAIWEEIQQHVSQLDDFALAESLPQISLSNKTLSNDSDPLIQFAFDTLDLIVPEMACMAHQAIVEFFHKSENEEVIYQEIKNRIRKTGLIQTKALSLLLGVVESHSKFVKRFDEDLALLCASDDLITRFMALNLSNQLSINPCFPSGNRHELPLAYKLELLRIDNKEDAIPAFAIRSGETYPDVNDSIELTRPFLGDINLISSMSGLPIENILFRASELMKSLVPQEEWNKEAEIKYREWMEGLEIKLTYHRLRPQVAKLALSYVVCELLDAGCIPADGAEFLGKLFDRADNYMLLQEPKERPNYIAVPETSKKDIYRKNSEWLGEIDDAFALFTKDVSDGEIILGELTTWCWLDWEKPTETRMAMVCHPSLLTEDDVDSPSSFFPHLRFWQANQYPEVSDIREQSLVIYGSNTYVDHGGLKWLALNPNIGFALGWAVAPGGLFRWLDSNGDLMVESLHWKDGPLDRQPPQMDDICADGWLVIATQKAVDEIQEFTGRAKKINSVIRSYGRDPYDLNIAISEASNSW